MRTALGDLVETYSHTKENPIHRTGQGSCASPAIWLMAISFLMRILKAKGQGMTMEDVNGNIVKEIIEGFDDDTLIFTNKLNNELVRFVQLLEKRW
jgi:hypothetical protein